MSAVEEAVAWMQRSYWNCRWCGREFVHLADLDNHESRAQSCPGYRERYGGPQRAGPAGMVGLRMYDHLIRRCWQGNVRSQIVGDDHPTRDCVGR